MNESTIILTLLLLYLFIFRITNPTCRWLYKWWIWESKFNECVETIKNHIGALLLPVFAEAIGELGKCVMNSYVIGFERDKSSPGNKKATTDL